MALTPSRAALKATKREKRARETQKAKTRAMMK
jgi:hypothetical protein